MAEFRSALEGRLKPGRYGAVRQGSVALRLKEKPTGVLSQLVGWEPDFAEQVGPMLSAMGFEGLGDYRSAQSSGNDHCFRLAPTRLLIRTDNGAALAKALSGIDASTVQMLDLSHARSIITVSGAASEDLMARIATLDFSTQAFSTGRFAQTELHHTSTLIHRTDHSSFDIYLPSTWAVSLMDYICVCASPIGYEI